MPPSPKPCSQWLCRQQRHPVSCPYLKLPQVRCFCPAVERARSAGMQRLGAEWHCLLLGRSLVLPGLCLNAATIYCVCSLYSDLQVLYLCRSTQSWFPDLPIKQTVVMPSSHACVDARKEKDSRTHAVNLRKQRYSVSPPVASYRSRVGGLLNDFPAYKFQCLFPSPLSFASDLQKQQK